MSRKHEDIAKVAYEIYEKRGGRHGRHLDDWLEAERIVTAKGPGQPEKKEKPARKATKSATAGKPKKEKGTGAAKATKPRTAKRKTSIAKT